MRYYLGLDGGGTKTDAVIIDETGALRSHVRMGCTNHEMLADGFDSLKRDLAAGLNAACEQAGATISELSGAVFGMAGVDVSGQKTRIEGILRGIGVSSPMVFNDSFLGIKAAIPEGVGCSLVNGTGNTAGGIDSTGKWMQIGGVGYISGEEGGGGLIAQRTIRLVYDELFLGGPKTALTPKLRALLHNTDDLTFIDDVYERILFGPIKPKELVVMLFTTAKEGDAIARGALTALGMNFARMLAGCVRRLTFGDRVGIALVGSTTLKAECPLMLDTLKNELPKLTGKTHDYYPMTAPPVLGALYWAMENDGRLKRDIRQTIAEGLKGIYT